MSPDLRAELIQLAHHFGADEEYVRAGGGNASVKEDGVLHIKASGTSLADLRAEDLVPLRLEPLVDALTSNEHVEGDPVMAASAKARVGHEGGLRPSVEILFHALIPDPLVLHLHPLVANALTCNEAGEMLTAQLLGDAAVWVDYIDPGVPLARGIANARATYVSRTDRAAPAITMLGNHGIIVSGHSFEQVAERTTWLTTTISDAITSSPRHEVAPAQGKRLDNPEALAEFFRSATNLPAVTFDSDAFIAETTDPAAAPVSVGPLIPDQIVYAGSFPVVLNARDDEEEVTRAVAHFRDAHGRPPVVAVVSHVAAFAVGDSPRTARIALDTYRDALRVSRDADRLGSVRVMDERERHFIENWEAEAYRRSVSASS